MIKKKKLLVTGSTFPRWDGDTEPRFILDYAKAMTKYYEVHVLVPMAPGAKEEEMMEGVMVHRFHYFPIHRYETLCYPGAIVPRIKEKKVRIFLVPFLLIAMRKSIKKYAKMIDLVHAHWIVPQGIVQYTIKEVPYLITCHGGDVASLNIWPIKKLKKKTLTKAVATVGVSSHISNLMCSICPGLNPAIISMGFDSSKFSPEYRDENYYPHEKKNIVYVGRLVEIKGVAYLIEAMKKIDANLFIIGKGPLEEELKKKVKDNLLEKKVSFIGPKTHTELPKILASADLFVAPSIIDSEGAQEGLPVSIMEAMASGLPVVAGNSGGIKDIIEDGVNGYILNTKDINKLSECINKIILDEKLAENMKNAALRTSVKYSYEYIAAQYYKIINSVMDSTCPL